MYTLESKTYFSYNDISESRTNKSISSEINFMNTYLDISH